MKVHPAAWSLFLLLATGLVVAGFVALQPAEEGTPEFTVPTTNNQTFSLSEQRGSVVVLDIFQVSCESCKYVEAALRQSVPGWNASDVRVISVGAAPQNSIPELEKYAADHNITWLVAQDTDDIVEKFSAIGFPTVAIIDANGDVVFHRTGLVSASEFQSVVGQALAKERAPVSFARYSLWGLAIAAGVASFFSPCAVGLLPAYVAHSVRFPGAGTGSPMRRAGILGIVAASGLLLIFVGLGGLMLGASRFIAPWIPWLGPFIGIVFILVGLSLILRPYSLFLQRMFSPLTEFAAEGAADRGNFGYFLYGIGYGTAAAGCTAPVLVSIAALGYDAGPLVGVGLVLAYGLTAALFMVVLTMVVAGGRTGVATWIRRNAKKVEAFSALFFVAGGIFLLWFAWRAGTLPL